MRWTFPIGALGTVVAALCFADILTPMLISLLVEVGPGGFTSNVDVILVPALLIFLVPALVYRRDQQTALGATRGQRHERLLCNGDELECARRPSQQ
jgi:hypothetical protein